jgi:hypothetical protein
MTLCVRGLVMTVIHLKHPAAIQDEIAMVIAEARDGDQIVRVDAVADRLAGWYPGLTPAAIAIMIVEFASQADIILEFGPAADRQSA